MWAFTFPTADSRKDSKGNLSELVLPIKAMLKQNYWTFFLLLYNILKHTFGMFTFITVEKTTLSLLLNLCIGTKPSRNRSIFKPPWWQDSLNSDSVDLSELKPGSPRHMWAAHGTQHALVSRQCCKTFLSLPLFELKDSLWVLNCGPPWFIVSIHIQYRLSFTFKKGSGTKMVVVCAPLHHSV